LSQLVLLLPVKHLPDLHLASPAAWKTARAAAGAREFDEEFALDSSEGAGLVMLCAAFSAGCLELFHPYPVRECAFGAAVVARAF
jgi:hypothetical protein